MGFYDGGDTGGPGFDGMSDILSQLLGGGLIKSLFPHDTGPMGSAGMGMGGGAPLTPDTDPQNSIDAARNMPGNPMAPPAGMPDLPGTMGPNNPMLNPASAPTPPLPGAATGGIGSDYARNPAPGPMGPTLDDLGAGITSGPTPEQGGPLPAGPSLAQLGVGEKPLPLPSQGGPLPLTPPAPLEGAPGAPVLPPTATPAGPARGPMGNLLNQLIGGPASAAGAEPGSREAQFGWAPRGGQRDNATNRTLSSLGKGIAAGTKPGLSRGQALFGGFGGSLEEQSAHDERSRKQDLGERAEEFKQDLATTKLPFELDALKNRAKLLDQQAKVWGAKVDASGKLAISPTNQKMWQSDLGRQVMIDKGIEAKIARDQMNIRAEYSKDLSPSDKLKRDKALADVEAKHEKTRQELYQKYNITPAVAAKNKLVGQDAANAFDPHSLDIKTEEQFKALVPPSVRGPDGKLYGGWYVPKPGAAPIQRAPESVMDKISQAAGENEKAAQKDRDINDLTQQQYQSDTANAAAGSE